MKKILDIFPQDRKTLSRIQYSLLQKFEYNLNALKLILKGSILCGKVSIGICNKLRKYFLCPRSLLLAFNSHKKNSGNDFQKSFCSVLEYQYSSSSTCYIYNSNALRPALQHILKDAFLETARRQLQFGLISNVLLCLKIHHITSAGSSVFQRDELRGTVHPMFGYGVL